MTLINGAPTNGTWMGDISKPKVNMSCIVLYNATFKDDLNYFVMRDGPYYNHNDYTGNDYNFVSGHGYNVTYRYIKDSQNQGIFQNTSGFVAMVSDKRSDMPYEVKLHYKLNNTNPYQWKDTVMKPTIDYTTMSNRTSRYYNI
ncbi:MAG: hypothetical protein WBZ36_00545 [Candidatus Nitrosopolaris sp.]